MLGREVNAFFALPLDMRLCYWRVFGRRSAIGVVPGSFKTLYRRIRVSMITYGYSCRVFVCVCVPGVNINIINGNNTNDEFSLTTCLEKSLS